jgi:hypothetical protein
MRTIIPLVLLACAILAPAGAAEITTVHIAGLGQKQTAVPVTFGQVFAPGDLAPATA